MYGRPAEIGLEIQEVYPECLTLGVALLGQFFLVYDYCACHVFFLSSAQFIVT